MLNAGHNISVPDTISNFVVHLGNLQVFTNFHPSCYNILKIKTYLEIKIYSVRTYEACISIQLKMFGRETTLEGDEMEHFVG